MEESNYPNGINDLKIFFYHYQIRFDKSYKVDTKPVMYIAQENILNLFKIDLTNHRKARLALYYHLHMQPSEIDNMDYMDFEFLLVDLNELLKEKNNQEKAAYDDQKSGSPDYSKAMKTPKMNMPKMPKI